MTTFACCYGFRDEICLVNAQDEKEAVMIVESHLRLIGYTEMQVAELAVCVSSKKVTEIRHVDAV